MLILAESLLFTLAAHRIKTGYPLHGRIGIAVGEAISGVLGKLQPRFCVFGEGLQEAAELEQTGKRDAVHCSAEFLEILTSARAHDLLSRRHAAAASAEIAFQQQASIQTFY